jgi:hypothetical protein
MTWKFIVRNKGVAVLLIFITACSKANTTPISTQNSIPLSTQATEAPTSTEAPPATEASAGSGMPVAGLGQCANAYYPVREGSTWTYASTGGPAGGRGFTDTIASVRDDGFTLTSKFGELTSTQEWSCTPEGLVALQLGGTSLAIFDPDTMQVNLDVGHVSGLTFPNEIKPGDTWQHLLDFAGKITMRGHETDAKGDAQSNFSAVGYEKVTVPAGTFDALKIHVDTTFHLTSNFNGVTLPFTFTTPYDYWFVQGVGWVKASGQGTVDDDSFTETIELQSYRIP